MLSKPVTVMVTFEFKHDTIQRSHKSIFSVKIEIWQSEETMFYNHYYKNRVFAYVKKKIIVVLSSLL